MLLPDLILPSRINQCWYESGIDSLENCFDKKYFKSFPYDIVYKYNNRGFRDDDWPQSIDELQNSIWCIGDSFTVGIGSPREHTWPYLVSKKLNTRTINISMDGASNEWIARRAVDIFNTVKPKKMIVMWSYFHRRESSDTSKTDEQRRVRFFEKSLTGTDNDIINFEQCLKQVKNLHVDSMHFIIPSATENLIPEKNRILLQSMWNDIKGQDWPEIAPTTMNEYEQLPKFVHEEIKLIHKIDQRFLQLIKNNERALKYRQDSLVSVSNLDLARDGHHFGQATSRWIAEVVEDRWKSLC